MIKFLSICLFLCVGIKGFSQQQVDALIKEAQGFLAQKNYKQAQMSLQDAVNELNTILAKQLAEALPKEIAGLKSVDGEASVNVGAMGMMGGGMQITKTYRNEAKKLNEAEIMIMANAPMLSSLNMFLTNPAMLGQGQKSVRIGTRRAIMKTEMEDTYDDKGASIKIMINEVQVPLSQTLITFRLRAFLSEQDAIAFINKFDIEKIKNLLGE
ncbi:MAG: hypothetical protein SH818_00740 [Saprospiraceae bacterium]|nr:hypothetical protein [Saprospiraceae bacterium]